MQKTVVIVAGGSGTRMKSQVPKQFLKLKELPIIMHSINCFIAYENNIEIRVVLPENELETWKELCSKHKFNVPHQVFQGGITRFHSVKNGLQNLSTDGIIAVHDGVRPLVSVETIRKCFMIAGEYGAAIPVVDVQETIREVRGEFSVTVDRKNFKLVQTPQVFDAEILLNAYKQDYDESFTDDASVVESNNRLVMMVPGNRENIKITTPEDLVIAEALMKD
ncbi:MAG: 2-C-methyl-D-erythritol 4-phosphate cytidylyltransferase [Bacteroidales bacterium]|nr:2-C-methyl-D-erythritol 4-phosphate cytidylyltransferase [Bacteroidales bacterium]MBN2819530.1 2-C-methyl-D-erythritol 4-phosphate cytidylyltransferase [Bacteroidales bacterium]